MFEPMLLKHENKSRRHVKSFLKRRQENENSFLFDLKLILFFLLKLEIGTRRLYTSVTYSSSRLRL